MKQNSLISTLGLSSLLAFGLNCSSNPGSNLPAAKAQVSRISEKQAEQLAWKFFEQQFGGCGGPSGPVDKGSYWEFTTKIGYAAAPGPYITVDKYTGKVSSGSALVRLVR